MHSTLVLCDRACPSMLKFLCNKIQTSFGFPFEFFIKDFFACRCNLHRKDPTLVDGGSHFVKEHKIKRLMTKPFNTCHLIRRHDVAEVAGLASFAFGEENVDRYIMVWKKVRAIHFLMLVFKKPPFYKEPISSPSTKSSLSFYCFLLLEKIIEQKN